MEHADAYSVENRTGPLHHALGLTAAATEDDIRAALDRVGPPDDSVLAGVLGNPALRGKYEQLVYASTTETSITIDEEHRESLRRFAEDTGFTIRPVPGAPNTFAVSLDGGVPPVDDTARPPRPVEQHDHRVPRGQTESTGDSRSSVIGQLLKSLPGQIIAGVLLVAFLAGLAWMTAPKPPPPTPEETARAEFRSELRTLSGSLAELRNACHDLDALAKELIGPEHVWHRVAEDHLPANLSLWLAERDSGNKEVIMRYHAIVHARNEIDLGELDESVVQLTKDAQTVPPDSVTQRAVSLRMQIETSTSEMRSAADELRDLNTIP